MASNHHPTTVAQRIGSSIPVSQDPTNPYKNPHAHAPQTTSRGKPPSTKFLWVPYPDPEIPDIMQDLAISIEAPGLSERFLDRYPMFDRENIGMVARALGRGFVNRVLESKEGSSKDRRTVHQGVAMMQHLRCSFGQEVEFRSWWWLERQLALINGEAQSPTSAAEQPSSRVTLRRHSHPTLPQKPLQPTAQQHLDPIFHPSSSSSKTPCIIFLYWTDINDPPITPIYSTLSHLRTHHNNPIRAYPSHSEAVFSASKLGDIAALDAIAKYTHSYRPPTCSSHAERKPKHSVQQCSLAGEEQIIMKRTHSSGGEHVELVDGDRADASKYRNNRAVGHCWFGQAYEPFFASFGEFRVFIVAEKDPCPTALRGRTGRILHTIITEWPNGNNSPSEMHVRVASSLDFRNEQVSPLTEQHLHAFALQVYERLRERADWRENFESLEVGVRLDIGVGVEGARGWEMKGFFVNEITRWYNASWFSRQTLGEPMQEVAYKFAEAAGAYFGGEEVEL